MNNRTDAQKYIEEEVERTKIEEAILLDKEIKTKTALDSIEEIIRQAKSEPSPYISSGWYSLPS